jgi:Mycobacterial cell wall arabinan synthesis protein
MTELGRPPTLTRPGELPPRSRAPRLLLAQVLAGLGFATALVGAVGPAERLQTTYSWPPATAPAATPERLWYTPLLLSRHRAETIFARLPCDAAAALAPTRSGVTVLATARSPREVEGLAVRTIGSSLSIEVGRKALHRIPLAPASDCSYELRLTDGTWSVAGGPSDIARSGTLDAMPTVTGLYSSIDLRRARSPSIEVTTAAHATRTIARQTLAWAIAALSIAGALFLVAFDRLPRPLTALRRSLRSVRANAHPVDGVVVFVLAGWWLLSPAYFDDGWIYAKQSMFSTSRGFSSYFIMFGTNAPLGYWLDWLQHWVTQSTSVLVVLRLPALLCLTATWVLCRYVLARVLVVSSGPSAIVLASLACAFLAGALAWGMTLRPEPMTALLVTGVAAGVIRFLERGTAAPLALVGVLVPLALTAHPSGIVSLAPVLVAGPALVRWIRARLWQAATIVTAAVAMLVALSFVGSDFEQRRLDAAAFRDYGSVADWHDELARYELMSAFPYGTPLRRLTVALMVLAALAFVARLLRRRRDGLLGFPSGVLCVAMVLLVATPSKWPWHFGTLIGFVSLAVAAETAWLREERGGARSWRLWPFAAVAAAVLAGAWAWGTRAPWNLVDLRTVDWHLGLERSVPLVDLAILLPVIALGGAIVVAMARGRREKRYEAPWPVATWTAPLLAIPILAFTGAVLLADNGRTESWTLARENVAALGAGVSCGLAEDVLVPVPGSARALPLAGPGPEAGPRTGAGRFVLEASAATPDSTPWFELPPGSRIGLFVEGVPRPSESLVLEWGRRETGRVTLLGGERITSVITELSGSARRQLYVAGELPVPDPRATTVRVALRTRSPTGARVAVSAPVTYSNESLAARIAPAGTRTLVHPDLLPYFPCAQLPRLRGGLAEPADYVVAAGHPSLPRPYVLSPLAGLEDVFEIRRLSTADSDDAPERVFVYELEVPSGSVDAPATSKPG